MSKQESDASYLYRLFSDSQDGERQVLTHRWEDYAQVINLIDVSPEDLCQLTSLSTDELTKRLNFYKIPSLAIPNLKTEEQQKLKNVLFEILLGQDVNNKNHGKLTQYQAKTFASLLGFTVEDIDLMEKSGASHDFGESRSKDVLFDYKNSDADLQEFGAYLEIMQELVKKDDRGMITPVLIYTIAEIIYKLEGQKPSKLHEAFNIVERLGYLRTGLVAWKRLKQARVINSKIGELQLGLSWLTHNVLLNQVPTLINDLSKCPVISKYLLEMAPLVAEAFDQIDNNLNGKIIQHYPEFEIDKKTGELLNKRTSKYKAFESAKSKWQEWLSSQTISDEIKTRQQFFITC